MMKKEVSLKRNQQFCTIKTGHFQFKPATKNNTLKILQNTAT